MRPGFQYLGYGVKSPTSRTERGAPIVVRAIHSIIHCVNQMKSRNTPSIVILVALSIAPSIAAATQSASAAPATVTEEVRKELMEARETAWRAFFEKDPIKAIENILGPEVIAIQESGERWENRATLLALGSAIKAQNVRILRLEFPHTEVQLFGDTAILYYTYVFTTGKDTRSTTDAGRGTEVFVRRNGRWIDVGWHLDHGPFVPRNGTWVRLGVPVAE